MLNFRKLLQKICFLHVPGETYKLHVKWLDFEASAVCTIPEPPVIDTVSLKLATIERPMFNFWKEYADFTNSAGMAVTAPVNVKGNVSGAIGYWAGYGIDVREFVCEPLIK